MSDLRLALRRLLRTPVFTLTALLVLALGIAANLYLVTRVRHALDQTPTYREPGRVVFIQPGSRRQQQVWAPVAARQLQELQGQSRTLDAWVGVRDAMGQLKGDGPAERIDVGCLTLGGLGSLGVPFALGLDAASPEDAVLSHGTWVRRFGQDPLVLGRSVWLDGRARRIVGVLREGVDLPFMLARSEVFVPLVFGPPELASRDEAACWVLARLAPGTSLAAARQELRLLARAVASPSQLGEGWTLEAQTMTGYAQQRAREGYAALSVLVVFLLLLISANVAGMHLARLGERAQESALRSALGADRASLLRALGLEALLLSLGGAVLGTAGLRVLLLQTGGKEALRLDWVVFLVVLALALVAALVTGLLPAWLGSRADLRTLLSQGASGTLGGGRMRWRKALVVTQVALTTLLLTGAGLAGQALRRMQSMDVGLNPAGVVGLQCTAPQGLDRTGRAAYSADLERFVAGQPGVRAVALASGMPLYHRGDTARFWVEDGTASTTQASFQHVSAGYFRTLDIPLRRGRTFEGTGAGECLVSEGMASRLWPGQSPLGRRLRVGAETAPWLTVVGVVADHRHNGFDQLPVDQVFTSYLAGGYAYTALLVRVDGEVASAGQTLAQALKAYRADLSVDQVESLQAVAEVILAGPRTFQRMLALGGLLAALLSGLGLHATARSLAVQRTREYGLRMALGASRTKLVGSALLEAFRPSGLGFALGQGAALALAMSLASQFQGVRFADLATLGAVTLAVGLMTLLAALLPALRAARVQPAVALRADS